MQTNIELHRPNPMSTVGVKLVIGLFFTILGLLLTLDSLDVTESWPYLRFWPAAVIAVGLLKMTDSGSRVVGIIVTIAGTWLLAYNARWIRFTIFDMWPLVFIGVGAFVVMHALGLRPRGTSSETGSSVVAILSTRTMAISPNEAASRSVFAFMAGCVVDLPAPVAGKPPVIIDVTAIWAGIGIRVPDGWDVVGEVTPVMGGFEVTARSTVTPSQQLVIRGAAVMAGIEVKRRAS